MAAPFFFSTAKRRLEIEASANLDNTRRRRAIDPSKAGGVDALCLFCPVKEEVCLIKGIECFQTKLKANVLLDAEVLRQRGINIGGPRAVDESTFQPAGLPWSVVEEGLSGKGSRRRIISLARKQRFTSSPKPSKPLPANACINVMDLHKPGLSVIRCDSFRIVLLLAFTISSLIVILHASPKVNGLVL